MTYFIKYLCFGIFTFLIIQGVSAQFGFSHEVGVIAGPVQFRSDFGQRFNEENNIGNTGYGIGLIHYINFSYRSDCNCYSADTYFNDHFKLRSEVSFNRTELNHFGRWVDPSQTSIEADRLRAHSGAAQNFDIGMQLEYFPFSIRSFTASVGGWAPFVSLGLHYTMSSPEQETTFGDGNILNRDNIYTPWIDASPDYPIDTSPINAWSLVSSIGVRYKLSPLSDLMIDLRYQYYFSDWIEGLNHELSSNKFNDVLIWLNFGYIYYLD